MMNEVETGMCPVDNDNMLLAFFFFILKTGLKRIKIVNKNYII